jgi:hypothetical protein
MQSKFAGRGLVSLTLPKQWATLFPDPVTWDARLGRINATLVA